MSTGRLVGDLYVDGHLRAKSMTIPNSVIGEAQLDPVLRFEHRIHHEQPNAAATAETRVKYVVRGATGEVMAVTAGSIVAATGNATVTIDVQKSTGGGAFATVLAAPIVLDSTNVARVLEDATLVTSGVEDLLADDLLQVVITINAGTGTLPTGVFVSIGVEEDRP